MGGDGGEDRGQGRGGREEELLRDRVRGAERMDMIEDGM